MTINEIAVITLGVILIGGHLAILYALIRDKLTKQTTDQSWIS